MLKNVWLVKKSKEKTFSKNLKRASSANFNKFNMMIYYLKRLRKPDFFSIFFYKVNALYSCSATYPLVGM